jgi:hypothetical protein
MLATNGIEHYFFFKEFYYSFYKLLENYQYRGAFLEILYRISTINRHYVVVFAKPHMYISDFEKS